MTKIEWTDTVWNPVTGCSKVSQGCKHCYAERMATRLRGRHGYPADDPFRVTLRPDRLNEPLGWKKPRRVFVNSMSDLFHEDVPDEFIDRVVAITALRPDCTFQVLTKRPERMARYMADVYGGKRYLSDAATYQMGLGTVSGLAIASRLNRGTLPNVWLGVSVENQATADERIPHLIQTPAAVRFLSCEPLLGPVDLARVAQRRTDNGIGMQSWEKTDALHGAGWSQTWGGPWIWNGMRGPHLHWVICGGESGPGARPMDPEWARSIRDQCVAARVPFFFKQWGGVRKGKDRTLDGRTWDEFPGGAA